MASASEYCAESMDDDEVVDGMSTREIIRYVKQHNVDQLGKRWSKIEDFKTLVKLQAAKNHNYTNTLAAEMLQNLQTTDIDRQKHLLSISEKTQSKIESIKKENEKIYSMFEVDEQCSLESVQDHIEQLRSEYCNILVMGEPSAGKTSFVNLLLGQKIFPSYHLSNTSVICEVVYCKNYEATIYPFAGDEIVIKKNDGDDIQKFMEQLSEYVEEKNIRGESKYKLARIGLPCDLLKTGLCIVDSPGVGEIPQLTDQVLNYMRHSFAFIYVLNSMNAGGLHSKKISELVEKMLEKRTNENANLFLPQSALFICNKWDAVDSKDREDILRDTRAKLSRIWPGFSEKSLFCLSTEEAMFINNNNYTALQFRKVLRGLKVMIPYSLEGRICHIFWSLRSMVNRIQKICKNKIINTGMNTTELSERKENLNSKIDIIEKNFDKFFTKQQEKNKVFQMESIKELRNHFQSEITKSRLFNIDNVPGNPSGKEFKEYILEKIKEKLKEEINHFEETYHYFRDVNDKLFKELKEEFKMHEELLKKFDEDFEGKCHSRNYASLLTQESDSFWQSIGWVVSRPFTYFTYSDSTRWRDTTIEYKYREKGKTFLQQYISDMYKKILLDEYYDEVVRSELQSLEDYISYLKTEINKFKTSNKRQVEQTDTNIKQDKEFLENYKNINNIFGEIRQKLSYFEFTEMYQHEAKVKPQNHRMTYLYEYINKGHITCSGLNSELYKGTYTNDKCLKEITLRHIKYELNYQNIESYLHEEDLYRNAKRPDIVQMIGITNGPKICFQILNPIRCSLREYSRENKSANKLSFCHDILKDIAVGLEYLHKRNLVHFDLSQDTLAVTHEGAVQLTNISTKKTLDEIYKNVLPLKFNPALVYIAPNIFCLSSSGIYNEKSDLYSLGLLIWEILTGKIAFEKEYPEYNNAIKTGVDFFKWLGKQKVKEVLKIDELDITNENWKLLIKNVLSDKGECDLTAEKLIDYCEFLQ